MKNLRFSRFPHILTEVRTGWLNIHWIDEELFVGSIYDENDWSSKASVGFSF